MTRDGIMNLEFTRARVAVLLVLVSLCGVPYAAAQRANAAPRQSAADLGQADVQRLFDAYTAMQAQEVLNLDDGQFSRFLPRLKALHATRRRLAVERQRLVMALGKLSAPAVVTLDEASVREQLKALSDLDGRVPGDLQVAYDALDQTLDLRQQARFRQFEQQVERRKFDLMLQARRAEKNRNLR
jgi:hypothetical protein